MIDAILFADAMDRWTNKLAIDMDSELVGNIFKIYEKKCSYDNYNLLELVGLCQENEILATCPLNRKAIIEMIDTKNIDIPLKHEPMNATKWEQYMVRNSLCVIKTKYMEFYEGSIIQMPDGDPYIVEDILCEEELISDDLPADEESSYKEVITFYLKNLKTDEESKMSIEDFMHNLDYEDVTILQDRKNGIYMNEEQKELWTNHIRWI